MNVHAPHVTPDPHGDALFDTERQLLGGLLAHGQAAIHADAAAVVGPEHFADAFNGRLFALIGQGFEAGLSGFRLTHWVIGQLRDDATLKEASVTGSALVASYVAHACPQIGVEACARQVKHDWLNAVLHRAVEDGDTEKAEATAAEMERLSRAHLNREDMVARIDRLSDTVTRRLSDAYAAGTPPKDFAFPGSHALARILSGWRRGRFYVIAGRPGMGKSTVALSWLLRTAQAGHGVLFFSLEMGADELTEMALCDLAWSRHRRVEYRDISTSQVTKDGFRDKFEAVLQVEPLLRQQPFAVVDRPGLTVAQIRSLALQHRQRLDAAGVQLDVIVIDHLNLIAPSDSYKGNKSAETEEISMSLKRLAKELDIAVVSLVQLNRAVEGREDKRPGLSDLRWSGAIEQDADVVMFLYREAYYLERKKHDDLDEETARQDRLEKVRNEIEVIFAKHRGGPCPVVPFFADMGCAVIRDREWD